MNSPLRPESEVFADLGDLCKSPGYVHAIAFFCWRDNLIKYEGDQILAKDMEHQHSTDRLLRTEISTLIGLMVRHPIVFDIPTHDRIDGYVSRTEQLLHELHLALSTSWFEGTDFASGETLKGEPFNNASAMREPIFYSGESAYNFQYITLAKAKYAADEKWIVSNKGFTLDDACKVIEALAPLQSKKLLAAYTLGILESGSAGLLLSGFCFTAQEVSDVSGVQAEKVEKVFDAFTYDLAQRNTSFVALNEFNSTNAFPVFKIDSDTYLLLQHYNLVESFYESPFFWMGSDSAYTATAQYNRGKFTENFSAERLEMVFGKERVWSNVDIYQGKVRIAEADVLVVYGDYVIVVQAKSKRLTLEGRKGNDLQLKSDFKLAIQDAYDQAVKCAEALVGDDFRFTAQVCGDIKFSVKPRVIFPVCIVADHYPALAFQSRAFLKTKKIDSTESPLVTDVFLLDVLTEMLSSPFQFLNFLALRARADEKLMVTQELTTLGYHLKFNLWLEDEYSLVNLGDDFTVDLDIAMLARRAGAPGAKIPVGILTRFDGQPIGRLFAEIERANMPSLTGLGLLLLQLGSKTARYLNIGIDRIVQAAKIDGKNHDLSIPVDGAKQGFTIHCNDLPEFIARERLTAHCRIRKYDCKADEWFGLLLDPSTGKIRASLSSFEAWQFDETMELVMKSWRRKAPTPIAQVETQRKIGRNETCPCGSGKKYKKCCLG